MTEEATSPTVDGRIQLGSVRPGILFGVGLGLLTLPMALLALAMGMPNALSDQPLLWFFAPAIALGVCGALIFPQWIVPGMVTILMSFPLILDGASIPLGFMRVYFADLLLVALGVMVLSHVFQRGWTIPTGTIPGVYWAWLALGCYALFNGFVLRGHEFDRAFGDFRRAFVCLGAFAGFLLVYRQNPDRQRLEKALVLGSVILILEGFWQVITGQFYTRRFTDAAHILTKFELQFLVFGVLLAAARLASGRFTALSLLLVIGGVGVTILGNFRSTWISLIGGMAVVFIYLPLRWRLLMTGYGAIMTVVAAAVLALVWNVPVADGGSTLGEDLRQKFDMRSARYDVNVTWRIESYANAVNLWKERPLLGQGLGVLTEFSAPTSTGGAQIVRGHRVHNSFLWILMSFGVVGSAVFTWWIISVFWQWHRAVTSRLLDPEERTLVVASSAFVFSFLISTSFEIFLESAPPVIMLAVVLALGTAAATAGQESVGAIPPVPAVGRSPD